MANERENTTSQPPWHVAIVSFFILTLELALIRQVPAEVRSISYFSNLLLMASFFGLGLGCMLQKVRSLSWFVPAGIVLLAGFIMVARGIVVFEEAAAVHYWLQYYNLPGTAPRFPLFPMAVLAFVLTSVPFVGLGQALARTMDQHPRLTAYGWDIAGSLGGTVAFAIGAYLEIPPWLWVPVGMTLWALHQVPSWPGRIIYVAAGMVFLVFFSSPHAARWSPYYYVQHRMEGGGLRVWVNSSFHQLALDLQAKDPQYARMGKMMRQKFGFPYQVYRKYHGGKAPRRVLILGAGTGNDVNIALENGADEITAVEIDPVIAALGRRHNSSRPYQSRKVRLVIDDARHFLWSCKQKFDMVVFGTLDSQTLLSGQANLRLENYVYTREAFGDVKSVLAPRGMFAAYYSVFKPWLVGRMHATIRPTFGKHVQSWATDGAFLFNTLIIGAVGVPEFVARPGTAELAKLATPATDDWPFIYLERPTISPLYLKLFAVLAALIIGAFFVVRTQHRITGLHTNFLLLGLGFTLMETASIVRLALLFGATWVTNVLVIFSFLLTILVANWLTLKERAPSITVAWLGLFGFIALNYFIPLQLFFAVGAPLRAAMLVVLIGLPVFFAAVCFSRLFSVQQMTGSALGMNLVGAMGGGLLEYFSMVTGMKAIWLLALVVYLGALLATRLGRRVV